MHNIYTTEGFILKSANFGEANKYFFIFTKEFGLIKASAQGVRLLKSKLRYSLEDFSFSNVSIVRGKEIWRLTSAVCQTSSSCHSCEGRNLSFSKEKHLLRARIFSLLLRLLHGEEKNELLFETLRESVTFLNHENLTDEMLTNFECILALRILSSLGYIGNLGDFNQFTASPYFTLELLTKMSALKTQAILEINKSLRETHL
jgi:DNA repair protein RecO (recombination protein O)